MDVLIDANIVIYSAHQDQENLRNWLREQSLFVSLITRLEVLGYHKISKVEIEISERFFSSCFSIDISLSIIETAVKLRQQKSMSVGDALIAATAIEESLVLVSANIRDFKHITDLDLINPIDL